jgi:calreticulin
MKILGPETKPLKFNSLSPYLLMFGPDVCEKNVHKLNFFITRNETQYDSKKIVDVPHDELTHSYTLIIYQNRTFDVRIDGESVSVGNLEKDFEYTGTEFIPDPEDMKPLDWEDDEEIPDPDDKKPADWDERPTIPDTTAKQPPEWREATMGKWQPPQIKNPDYLGVWKPKMIKNPKYKGEWIPRQISNPDYQMDKDFGVFGTISYWGIEVFQSRAGAIFDNFLLTDDVQYAEKKLRENFLSLIDDEKVAFKRYVEDKKADDELRKITSKPLIETTTAAFYSQDTSSDSDTKTDDEVAEPDSNFIFSSSEMSAPPCADDFEFPLNKANNPYFMKKEKQFLQVISEKARSESAKDRAKAREEREEKEDFKAILGETSATEL